MIFTYVMVRKTTSVPLTVIRFISAAGKRTKAGKWKAGVSGFIKEWLRQNQSLTRLIYFLRLQYTFAIGSSLTSLFLKTKSNILTTVSQQNIGRLLRNLI